MKPDLGSLLRDVQYAFKQFLKSPGFTIGVVVSLMLGIGATTTIFSIVYGVLLDPFPYKDANQILCIQMLNKSGHYQPLLVNGGHLQDVRNAPALQDVFFQVPSYKNLTGENAPLAVNVGFYSSNALVFLGVPPLLGRVFTPVDAPGGNPAPVAVLSYRFWKEHYFGSREPMGKVLELDHTPYTVIGVMPSRFTWFDSDVYLIGEPAGYWMVFTKLKPGTSHPAAEAELQALVSGFAKEDPALYGPSPRVKLATLNDELLGSSAGTVAALFAAATVLLIIACANVSILLLAYGTVRQHEFAVRTSLGAGRARLIRQLLTESVLLSVTGAAFGVLVAWWGVTVMRSMLPDELLSHEVVIELNIPVLLFSAVVSVITGILFGLSPAFELSRLHPGPLLQGSSMKVTGRSRTRHMHRLPIAGQVALTLLLLAGAGGAAKAFLAKLHAPQGFDPDHVFSMALRLPQSTGTTKQEQSREVVNQQEAIRQAVAHTPGVAEAGWSTIWQPATWGFNTKVEIQSKPALTDAQAVFSSISPQVLSVLRVPLLRGRVFDGSEVERQAHLALVNQAFVKQYLGDADPIGQSVRIPFLKQWDSLGYRLSSAKALDDWVEVIGVVGDATNDDLGHPLVRPGVFLPSSFAPISRGWLYVRANSDTEAVMRSARARLIELNPGLLVESVRTLQWELDNWGWGRERMIAAIFTFYAVIALVLAATGLYSVVSFAVTQRTQELGIRIALGAGRGSVMRLVFGSTLIMLSIGVAAGSIVSVIVDPLVATWGAGGLSQPWTLLGATSVLMLVAAIACALPALRAVSIDPMQVLRDE